jgi:NADH:ubiquinone oxidoreductase subunit 5 (subunit L)/multisubunit Na+/H+ antiporter MnhA subunit
VASASAAQLLAGMGAAAIVVGSVVALRQQRLKLLVAYSTVAQIGYLFLLFPLAFDAAGDMALRELAQSAGVLQAIAHATAKAGMFMAAGMIYAALGHDRIADLAGVARLMPVTVLAFAVAGLALMGVVPSGAYLAKKLLLSAADSSGQWWWTLVLQGGAAFTAGYLVLVLRNALRRTSAPLVAVKPVPLAAQFAALSLALCSLLLAFAALGPVPAHLVSNPLAPKELLATVLVLLGGVLLALGLSRKPLLRDPADAGGDGPLRRVAMAAGTAFERLDDVARRWPTASVMMLVLAGLFVWLMMPPAAG